MIFIKEDKIALIFNMHLKLIMINDNILFNRNGPFYTSITDEREFNI